MNKIKAIGFDADDTLWVNETFYRAAEKKFCELVAGFLPPEKAVEELFKTEMRNLDLYGFGAKGFMLSAIETALRISDNALPAETMREILRTGRRLLDFPLELLAGAEQVLKTLKPRYKLALVTKGDLLDQERKLRKSGLKKYFHHVEILSRKEERDYKKLLKTLGVGPGNFLMVGNSVKSDIAPVLGIGGFGVHVPFSVTWRHEAAEINPAHSARFKRIRKLTDLVPLLK